MLSNRANHASGAVPTETWSNNNSVGTMFLRVPGESASDHINQTRAVMRDGHAWM